MISRQSHARDCRDVLCEEIVSLTTNSSPVNTQSKLLPPPSDEAKDLALCVVHAVEFERFKLAHELHDGVGQILTGAVMLTEALRADLSGASKKDADKILHLIRKATHQVRSLSHSTSPEFLTNRDLAELLSEEVAYWNTYYPVSCYLDVRLRVIDEDLTLQLYRITQEAVHNAIQHGRANVIHINLRHDTNAYGVLEVINDGELLPSFSEAYPCGIGLRGMQHRAALIQASLDVANAFTDGVIVSCRFPLAQAPP